MAKIDYSDNYEFQQWIENQTGIVRSVEEQIKIDNRIHQNLVKEIELLKSLSAKQYALLHKQAELEKWLLKQSTKHIDWVKRLMWKPTGFSDYRRIQPQLVEVTDSLEIPSFNIWGEDSVRQIKNNEPYSIHWNILRTLVSRATNDGTVGRQIKFLVIDKNTKQYLGVICLSSGMYEITSIHNEIGWSKKYAQSKGSRLNNLANGQTIVPTPLLGSLYLGGKLLSLLCLSKDVAETWERKYGDKLVGVHTTSLWGTTNTTTQYDGLEPYFHRLDPTSGNTIIKPRVQIYDVLKEWLQENDPQTYFKYYVEKNENGMLKLRNNKDAAIKYCYRYFKIKSEDVKSNYQRGVYSSFHFKNSIDFLNGKITELELTPAFDNSIEALTEYWKFGVMGDTTKPTSEMRKKEKKPERLKRKVQIKGMVKGYVDKNPKNLAMRLQNEDFDWYLHLHGMSWDEIQKQYPDQPIQSEIQLSVQPTPGP